MIEQSVLGLPLEEAEKILQNAGYEPVVTMYKAKRDLEKADDIRVLRCVVAPQYAYLVASAFRTDVLGETDED